MTGSPDSEKTETPANASPPESYGRYLARERELRGLTLEHVSEVTRISLDHLTALEEGRHDRLAGRVFVIGYIRAYARCIGLSPDEAVLRYQEQVGGSADAGRRGQPPAPRGWKLVAAALAAIAVAVGAAWLFRRR